MSTLKEQFLFEMRELERNTVVLFKEGMKAKRNVERSKAAREKRVGSSEVSHLRLVKGARVSE